MQPLTTRKSVPSSAGAYRNGYYDGLNNNPRRGGALYKVYGDYWKAYQRGYANGEKHRRK